MQIYLIRHTKVNVKEGVCYGDSDVDLAESFLREAKAVQRKISHLRDFTLYTSPLKRCVELAEYLSPDHYFIQPRLKEMDFGTWTLKTWDSIPEEEIQPWYKDFVNYQIPGGESFKIFYDRVFSFFASESKLDQNMIWITHAGVIRALVCMTLGLDLKNAFRFSIQYGSLTIIEKTSDTFVLDKLNI